MRLLPTAALILGVAGLPSATAHAATTIGSTATTGTVGFAVPGTVVQASDGPFGPSYAAPSAGVIVSYTASAAWTPGSLSPTVALKVVRPLGGANYRVVGASRVSPVANGGVGTVSDSGVRIPVLAGDRLGVALGGNAKFVHEAGGVPVSSGRSRAIRAPARTSRPAPRARTTCWSRPGSSPTSTVTATETSPRTPVRPSRPAT